ncbi:MAG TPA: hypothetical protein VIL74_00480 [Pyrinomonadaceae bacterium]|jgi:hypothetical protein
MEKESTDDESKKKPKFYPYLDIVFFIIVAAFTLLTLLSPYLW